MEQMADTIIGNIDKETVQRAHFGGFDEEEESIDPTKRKSKKDIYKEIMAKSKMHKQDRQMQKQEDEELAREVDEELDEIRGLLQPAKKTLRELAEERKANDSLPPIRRFADGRFADEEEYDRFVKELQYEKRARPTDRTKTEEETALEEKKKLEDMEQERLKRMRGETIEEDDHEKGSRRKRNKNSSETKSEKPDRPSQADDLEDNVAWEASSGPASEAPLYYKDGVLQNQEIFLSSKRQRNAEDAEDDGHSGSGSEEEESGSDEEDSEASDSGDDGSNSEMESETDARVKESHLDQEGLDDSEEEQNMAIEENEESMKGSSGSEEEMEDHEEEEEEPQNAAKVSSMASATQELPYTFEAPSDIDAFLSLIKGISAEDVATVIHRIRVMYHKKLHPDNKQKLETLTRILYQYVDYLCSTYPVSLSSIDLITKHILELTQEYTDQVAQFAKTRIISMRSRLTKSLIAKRQSVMPLASELLFMKLMVHIFPGSDAVHTVMTPLILLMAQYLGQGVIKTEQDLASGLFISQLLLETQKLSKRYIPELVNFLYGSLFCFSSESMETLKAGPLANRVKVMGLKDCLNAEPTPVSFGQLLSPQASRQWTTGEQASLLSLTFDCTTEMIRLYSDLPSLVEILSYISAVLNAIDAKHPTIKDQMVEVKSKLEMSLSSAKLKRRPLEMQKRKAIPIQTYQPQFQTQYAFLCLNCFAHPVLITCPTVTLWINATRPTETRPKWTSSSSSTRKR